MTHETDILIVGAGPVGLMSAYLAHLSGLSTVIIDKSDGPLKVGRADALNARTLQLLELAGLFDGLYPLGRPCDTSTVFADGKVQSRQSSWWKNLEGCFHRHFLMLGQSHIENQLDQKLAELNNPVLRHRTATDIRVDDHGCTTRLSSGDTVRSRYVIGADGSRSFVRETFNIGFHIQRPEITWAVVDGNILTDYPKAPEIVVFQSETSDVAWIPREGDIDRFYIRMDKKSFTMPEVLKKINRAMQPYSLKFLRVDWLSQFSVKESVAERFSYKNKVFLAGDACHIHSVNGGQGLNTGLADAFNLIWKLKIDKEHPGTIDLSSYEAERKPVAESVIKVSGDLVRTTKFAETNSHAKQYLKLVEAYSGNITGMGITYPGEGMIGHRLHDMTIKTSTGQKRLYSLLDYQSHSLISFGDKATPPNLPKGTKVIRINANDGPTSYSTENQTYPNQQLLIRPDGYIAQTWND